MWLDRYVDLGAIEWEVPQLPEAVTLPGFPTASTDKWSEADQDRDK
jgi:hypothetical protein